MNKREEHHAGRWIAIVAIAMLAMTASCSKTCTCVGNNGKVREYTREEVKAHGGSCYDMRVQAGTIYYAHCEW